MTERIVHGRWDDEDEDTPPVALTREQAQALRAELPSVSAWQVVAAQALAGLSVAVLCLLFGGSGGSFWSALYGTACIVLPSALLARGMARLPGRGPAAAAVGFSVGDDRPFGFRCQQDVLDAANDLVDIHGCLRERNV